ncbi:MAG TPA: hypothetical protein VHQ65_07975 [Thermoanaerobaculia bacterium]|nr:hypothetical protein [Thermoanaerobaculia bacterium]
MPRGEHPEAWPRALAHSLTGCSRCTRRVLEAPDEGILWTEPQLHPLDPALLREIASLRRRSPAQRVLRARNASDRWRRSAAGALLSLAHRGVLEDPGAALDQGRLAVMLADSHTGPERAVLRVEARAALANAQRVLGEFDAAESTWAEIDDLRRHAELTPVRTGHLHMLRASLEMVRSRYPRAFGEVTDALRLFAAAADAVRTATALIKMGIVQDRLGDPAAALATNRQAALMLAALGSTSSRLRSMASHNLAVCALSLGDWRAAEEIVTISRPLQDRIAARMERVRLDWLDGLIDRMAGRHRQAEAHFLNAARVYSERRLEIDTRWIHLHLMEVYLAQRRPDRVRELGEPALACFRRHALDTESAKTVRLLDTADELDRARREGGEEALHRVPLPAPQVY